VSVRGRLAVLVAGLACARAAPPQQVVPAPDASVPVADAAAGADHLPGADHLSNALPFDADPPRAGACGFAEAPAFCDDFEQGPLAGGRAGELDPARWSGMRAAGDQGSPFGNFISAVPAPACRAGLTGMALLPDQDAVICDATAVIPTRHLMTATSAQNYGLNSYRIRQPFDFAGRTGTIKLDVDLSGGLLHGWPAIGLSQDPTPAPTFDFPERGSGPRQGLLVEFVGGWCGTPNTRLPVLYTYSDYLESAPAELQPPAVYDCKLPHVKTELGALNHVELKISRTTIEIWASDPSPDGKTFPNLTRLYAGPLSLSFERGFVNLIARNHATIKYMGPPAWIVRWDNVGFDGPVVGGWREHSAPDSLKASDKDPGRSTGYVVPSTGEPPVRIELPGVRLAGANRARLIWAATYPSFAWNGVRHPPTHFNLRHRLNGGGWHDRFVSAVEVNAFTDYGRGGGEVHPTGEGLAGLLNQVTELDLGELRDGDNFIELVADGTWTGSYRVGVVALDLVLDTAP
jgi:hypothetical protein